MSVDEIYHTIMNLPESDRSELLDKLWEADAELSSDVAESGHEGLLIDSPDLADEIARRLSDREGSIPLSQLREQP